MTAAHWTPIAMVVACALLGVVAWIGNRMSATPPTEKEAPMALHDYRKLIDDLRYADGTSAYATIEVLATNSETDPIVRIELVQSGQLDGVKLDLTEFDAGAIYDGLGGALRELSAPLETLPPIGSWANDVSRKMVRTTANALLVEQAHTDTGEPDATMDDAVDDLQQQLRTLTRSEAIELCSALVTYGGAIVAAFAFNLSETGATVDLSKASA